MVKEDKPLEEMSLEELKKLKEEKEKALLIKELSEEQDIPENPVANEGESHMSEEATHVKVLKRWTNNGLKFIPYENETWIYENDSDSGCEDDVSEWSPDDVYANIVWSAMVSEVDLMPVAVKGIDIRQGDGLSVKIRAFGSFGEPSEKASCEGGSCASITFSTYTLTLKQYNLEAIICDKDIWDVGSVLMDSYLKAMADSWRVYLNKLIYNELKTATAGHTETLNSALSCDPAISGSCCSDSSLLDLYNAILSAIANRREANYNPDYIIMSPSVANIFKRMQTPQPVFFDQVEFDSSGRLSRIAGLKVIEYDGATSCTSTSGAKVAIIVDSRRAVGVAFGQKPKLYKFFMTNYNSYRIDMWAYFAVSELDTGAIVHIVNP